MPEISYINTNYWIYWFDEILPEHDYVDKVMQSAIKDGAVVSTVTLMEVAHYFKTLPSDQLAEKMDTIASRSTLDLIDFTSDILTDSIKFLSTYSQSGLGGRDCVILATMKSVGSTVLLTHDKAFKKVKNIKIIDEIQ